MRLMALIAFAALAACGADGAPEPPAAGVASKTPGISISGEASAGIVIGGNGG